MSFEFFIAPAPTCNENVKNKGQSTTLTKHLTKNLSKQKNERKLGCIKSNQMSFHYF